MKTACCSTSTQDTTCSSSSILESSPKSMNDAKKSRKSSTTGNNSSSSSSPSVDRLDRAICCARIVFLTCLLLVAATLGSVTHFFLTNAEIKLANSQYESIADRALTGLRKLAEQKRWAAITVASMVSENFPNASTWPLVSIRGFERIVDSILYTSSNVNMGFAPIVRPDQLDDWEEFIFNYYENIREPPIPANVTTNSFGRGVWAVNVNLSNVTDKRYRDTGTSTIYGSPNEFVVPLAHLNQAALISGLLYNVHSEPSRGRLIDQILECSRSSSKQRAAAVVQGGGNDDMASLQPDGNKCGGITTMIPYYGDPTKGPSSSIYVPIYPADDPTSVVGFISTLLVWHELLQDTFSSQASGIHCVLETNQGQVYTFRVVDGVAIYIGEGDLHQPKYDAFRRPLNMTDHSIYETNSPVYTLCLYPTDEWYEVYSTSNPTVAMFGSICVIIFTSALFYLYDSLVRRELLVKKGLLDAKRKFMRFVSHEVRTPLNSVCMGIAVLQQDIATSLGYESSEKLRDATTFSAIALDESQRSSEQMEWFKLTDDVLRHTQTAVDVLSDLLHYDKIESGSLTIEREVVAIWHLIESSIAEFKLPAMKKNINLRLDFADCQKDSKGGCVKCLRDSSSLPQSMLDCKVRGDAARLTQVLRNLLSNAVKFTPEGGDIVIQASCTRLAKTSPTTPTATGSAAGEDDFVDGLCGEQVGFLKVSVKDSGAGMTAEQLSTLFREGVQFNAAALQEGQGSGFGLYISKGIVDLHGGTLEATSDGLNQGATFTMNLPLYDAPISMEPAPTQEETPDGRRISTAASLNLLVVDDSLSNRKLLGRLLTRAGHACDLAEDGAQAVKMVVDKLKAGERYDSILLDYEMPVMNGPSAAMAMRKAGSDVHIVGVTGNVLPDDVAHFISCGANAVVPKPVKLSQLSELWIEHGVIGQTEGSSVMASDNIL